MLDLINKVEKQKEIRSEAMMPLLILEVLNSIIFTLIMKDQIKVF